MAESEQEWGLGLGLLPEKTARQTQGRIVAMTGPWVALQSHQLAGYEIHTVQSIVINGCTLLPLLQVVNPTENHQDGAVTADGWT